MDRIVSNLDSTNTIKKNLPKIIDSFVMVYGEEYREFITDKLNNVLIVGYYSPSTLDFLLLEEKRNITNELIEKIFDRYGISNTKSKRKIFTGDNSFEFYNQFPIVEAVKYIEMTKRDPFELLKEIQINSYNFLLNYIPDLTFEDFYNRKFSKDQLKLLPKFIRDNLDDYYDFDIDKKLQSTKEHSISSIIKLHPGATEVNVEELIKTGKLDYLIEIRKAFEESYVKYQEFIANNLQTYIDYNAKMKKYSEKLESNYFLKALLEFKDYLNLEEQAKLDEMIANNNFDAYKLFEMSGIFGLSLKSQKAICYFDETSDKQLINPGISEFIKETIIRNRINYFKHRGIDLGEDYESYINNPQCKSIWPTYEEIRHIEERFDFYLNEYNIELYTNNKFYIDALAESKRIGLLDKNNLFNPSNISFGMTCVLPNIIEKEGEYHMYPILAINSRGEKTTDVRLIHELNHIIELALIEVSEDKYSCICGWDMIEGNINQSDVAFTNTVHKNNKKGKYEMFNEIINELLAQKVSSNMHENGLYVLTDKDNVEDCGGTSYERSIFLVREFFDTYLQDIIASRRNNNIQIIWDKVGKENFDMLNDLFHDFYEEFPDFIYYELLDDIKDNKDTPLVQKYNGIKSRKDKILLSMKEYSKNSQIVL